MKIIGITGNSGSGKTTFSNALDSKKSVSVIHVDTLVGEAKQKYFKRFLQSKENNITESTSKNPKLKIGIKRFFYKSKFTFKFLMALRSKLVESSIKEKINQFKKEGKELVVIDDWVLSTHKWLDNQLSHTYVLNRNYSARRAGIRTRDDLSTEELKVADLPYALRFVKIPEGEKVTQINNNGSIEELEEKALNEATKYVSLTFDERYKIDINPPTFNSISKALSTTKDYSKRIRNKGSK